MNKNFNHDGKTWEYIQDEMWDDEGFVKLWHEVVCDDTGVSTHLDWSPYSSPDLETLRLWIDLGMPNRTAIGSIGPINREDLDELYLSKFIQKYDIALKLIKAFPEAGIITLTNMFGAYEQLRESYSFYYGIMLKAFKG